MRSLTRNHKLRHSGGKGMLLIMITASNICTTKYERLDTTVVVHCSYTADVTLCKDDARSVWSEFTLWPPAAGTHISVVSKMYCRLKTPTH